MTRAALPNPGYLKLELSARGVRLDPGVRAHPDLLRAARLDTAPAAGIELVLPEDVVAHAPIDARDGGGSPFVLCERDAQFTLQRNEARVGVRLVPQPRFYDRSTTSGRPMWQVGMVYGSCIAINPAAACSLSLRGAPCRFCRSGSGVTIQDGFPMSVQEVVEVVRAAFAEGAADFVYLNPSYVGSEDAGCAFLEPYVQAIKKHFDTLVALQIHPPRRNRWIDRAYAMGVDAVSYNVEIRDAAVLAQRCPGRVRHIGRERYYEALAYAAGVFPSGTVWSELLLGVEPAATTVDGIDALVRLGVLPVLAVARPEGGRGAAAPPSLETVRPICTHLFHAVRQAKINMGWVRDLSFAITPLEARFFAGDDARVAVAMQQFYRSRLGTLAARGLARLRRQLRVRTVSDSFDSARL